MFLDEDYSLPFKILSEATDDEDGADEGGMEDEAEMNNTPESNDNNEENNDDNSEDDNMDDGMDDDGMGDNSGEENAGMGEEPSLDSSEALKKRRLFDDYKNLYEITNELLNTINYVNYRDFNENEKKIFNFLEEKMKDNKEKLRIILIERFATHDYKSLLTMFIYFKMSIKNYTEIVNKIIHVE